MLYKKFKLWLRMLPKNRFISNKILLPIAGALCAFHVRAVYANIEGSHPLENMQMDIGVYKISEITNAEILTKIRSHESFTLECEEHDRYKNTLVWLERTIEAEGMKVRIYMKARVATMATAAWTGWGTVAAAAAGLAIAAHNAATWSPDYEIAKHPLGHTLYVTYNK